MKPRFIIFILILAMVILAVLLWHRPVQSPTGAVTQPEATVQASNAPMAQTASMNVTNQSAPAGINPPPAASSNEKSTHPITNKMGMEEMLKKLVQSANVPIEFYGRVIDQDSNALSGAKIKIGILHLTLPNPLVPEFGSKNIQLEQISDANGRFEFHGETGEGFGVVITKDGYDAEPGSRGFGGGTSGSYENPVIFKMWSTNIHEKLITGEKTFEILPDGRLHVIDLVQGTIAEAGEGDLKVWIQYTNQVTRGQLYDWSAGIEVMNGGLLEEPRGTVMYSAPTDGYTSSFQLKQQIKGGQSGEIGDRSFYLLLNNGKEYGRMDINLYAAYGYLHPGLIRLSYAINPSGSRILR